MSNEGQYCIKIKSSEPYEVKSVDIYFKDPDGTPQFSFIGIVGWGGYETEYYYPDAQHQAFHTNLFTDMKVYTTPTLEANKELNIYFRVEYPRALRSNTLEPDQNERK